ncbi:hypothetical protein C8J56DRAFT_1059287 [Mycena floridula]|nr:hypothetical protein C8J56DRAFT_1059287 [Mycena floridula]
MFILITMRCIIDTFRCVVAFDNPDMNFGAPNSIPGILTNICWILVTAVADAFIIFRTFTVWNRCWTIIILPVMLFMANFALGGWFMTNVIRSITRNEAIWSQMVAIPKAFIALTLCTNVICTATLICTQLASFVAFILADCIPPTIGLVFSHIIIAASRGSSYESMETTASFHGERHM